MFWIDAHRVPLRLGVCLLVLLVLSLFGPIVAHAAPAVTLTATPTTGVSPLSVTLTWNATGFAPGATCAGAGATPWNGTKAITGSQAVSLVGGLYSLAISCSDSVGSADLAWTNPTQNEDGSTIPATGAGSLAGTEVFSGTTSTTPIATAAKGVSAMTVTGLAVGPNSLRLKAFNTEAVRSVFTNAVTLILVGQVATANAAVTVNSQPKPPSGFTAASTVAFELKTTGGGVQMLGRDVGSVKVGAPCGTKLLLSVGGKNYYELAPADYTLYRAPKYPVVTACVPVTG